ncbi:MAG: sel1 repeat family protein [Deltaproteobacteria bacterium]|nr:sel1 repeat family protein [Deltaproteobacteria bacterium]
MTMDEDYEIGDASFQQLVRGDAVIGLISDVPGMERRMMDALWRAAARGSARAYRRIGDCYLATRREIGAFHGVDAADAATRPWSSEAQAIVDEEDPAVEAALRAYFEAARLGLREAAMLFARASRASSRDNQRRALTVLEGLHAPTAEEVYQAGLVQNWLGELAASAKTHHRAAEAGSMDAAFELHILYAQGLGVERDVGTSEAWLQRAAEGHHPRALYNLGAAWASGRAGAVDMEKAADYYRRAAEYGNARAAATLGVMILTGELAGTEEEACSWLDQADEGGSPSWEMLDAVGLDDPRARGPESD